MRRVVVWLLVALVGGQGRAPALRWRARRDVDTAQGTVRGYLGARHYAFLGIPYVRPPTLTDRFKAPEPPPQWDGILEATYRVRCPQPSGGDENCLVVNVFVPQSAQQSCPLPVLVHVHDGGFHGGWGLLKPPTKQLDDFIIVSFNYRVGTLGFLCLGTPEAPGNAGLKDQVAALYWVQQNIASFGGNPADVTLYGTGSGATSAQLLVLSGLVRGLIHRVIFESGSVLSPASMAYNPLQTALNTAVTLGFEDQGATDKLVEFYQNLSVKELVNVSANFLPCVESKFLYAHSMIDQDPIKILRDGHFEKVPTLIVYSNANEIQLIEENYERFTVVPEFFEGLLPSNIEFVDDQMKYKIADLVKDFYFEETESNEKVVQDYKDYINDIFIEYPVYNLAALYSSKTAIPVYIMKYMYNTDSKDDNSGMYADVFNYIFIREDLADFERVIAEKLVSLLVNFMKIGDPTPLTTELVPVVWEPFNPQGIEVVDMSRPCLLFGHSLRMGLPQSSERLNFWEHIYSKYHRKLSFDGE